MTQDVLFARAVSHLSHLVDSTSGTCVELRCLDVVTRPGLRPQEWCGFYSPDKITDLVRDAFRITKFAKGCYVTLNPLRSDLLSRRNGRCEYAGRGVPSGDTDVTIRRWLYIDFDSVTPISGVCATEEEKQHAIDAAWKCSQYLSDSHGFHDGLMHDSGNGANLVYRIEMPNDDETRELIRRFLRAIKSMFSGDKVKVDTSVYNAGRIFRLPGTWNRKGENTKDRPYRIAQPINVPEKLVVIDEELIRDVAALAPLDPTPPSSAGRIRSVRGSRYSPTERARMFVDKLPGTNSGEGDCHNRTLDTANSIVNGFGLPFDVAMQLIVEWNAKCSPPWSDGELRHKIESAIEKGDPSGRPVGWMLSESQSAPQPPSSQNEFEAFSEDPLAGLGLQLELIQPSRAATIHEIQIGTDEHRVNDAAVRAIAQDPGIYQRVSQLVHVVCEAQEPRDDDGVLRVAGSPQIRSLPLALVRE